MKISALGHSCVLLDFTGDEGSTRILVDPWLSDHAVGDAMGRFPRVRFDAEVLAPLDAIYLTHAHSDHLDPYTLLRLWRDLPAAPALILPVSLAFLVPVFRRFLDDVDIVVLHPHEPTTFRGVELMGVFDVGSEPTNEDDVMVLVVTHGSERVLVEADARLSLEFPTFRAYISSLLCAPGVRSAVYLTTENELTGTLASSLCDTLEERQELAEVAMDEMLASVVELYTPPEPNDDAFLLEDPPPPDLWQAPHLIRLVHGQGLTAPSEFDREGRWRRILFPVSIADRVRAERAIAEANGCRHGVDGLIVGQVHHVVDGRLVALEPIVGLDLLDDESDRTFDPELAFFPDVRSAPVRDEERYSDPRDPGARAPLPDLMAEIADLLNHRFLPFLVASRSPPLLHLLSGNGGEYRVRVHLGESADQDNATDFVLRFQGWGFVAERPTPASPPPDEAYWALDLENFMTGRLDEFTSFVRRQLPAPETRLVGLPGHTIAQRGPRHPQGHPALRASGCRVRARLLDPSHLHGHHRLSPGASTDPAGALTVRHDGSGRCGTTWTTGSGRRSTSTAATRSTPLWSTWETGR